MNIEGNKINLRKLKKSDAQSIYQNIKDKEVHCNLLVSYPYRLKDAEEFILKTHRNLRSGKSFDFGIENKKTGQIIGMISLMKINKEHKHAELGYWLGKKYHRQGIMNEAVIMIINFAFKKLRLKNIWAGVFSTNIASANLLKKIGFKYRGGFKDFFFRYGIWHDDNIFQLSKEYFKK